MKVMEMVALDEKITALEKNLSALLQKGLIVAFSGGVDSCFLLWMAREAQKKSGGKLLALTAVSASMPEWDKNDARQFSETLGVEHAWQESQEFENPQYLKNNPDRCYHCKTELFRIGKITAQAQDFGALAYGYNASDHGDVRPGHAAALENGVHAPLSECGLTKDEIRFWMRWKHIPFSDKPSSPCLSSRVMHGVSVTQSKLADIEALESLLREGGLNVFRVRHHEDGQGKFIRLEVGLDELDKAILLRERFSAEGLKRGYRWVTLDLAGYRMGGARL